MSEPIVPTSTPSASGDPHSAGQGGGPIEQPTLGLPVVGAPAAQPLPPTFAPPGGASHGHYGSPAPDAAPNPYAVRPPQGAPGASGPGRTAPYPATYPAPSFAAASAAGSGAPAADQTGTSSLWQELPTGGPGGAHAARTAGRRRGPGWPGVAVAAVVAAVVASLATAGLTGAFSPDDGGSGTYSALGREQISIPVAGSTADNPDWQVVAAAVRDSVVAITVRTSQGEGEGSGVIISADGEILTNHHVVSGGDTGSITVALADGRLYDAKIVGTDPTTDIAVLRLVDPPDDLAVATLGDSDDALVGAAVMAVGNPLGLDTTVTTGIISAVDRPVSTQEQTSGSLVVTNAIQVDAAINPGNSGGPLFNSSGEVIGITSSIATLSSGSTSGSIGLGFAIPINQATLIADQLIESGTAEHAYLGVSLSDGTATADGTTRQGALVETVSAGTPAEDAGIQEGDVIVGIDGKAVAGAESLTGYVRQYASGVEVTLTVVRDGRAMDVTAVLATKPVEDTTSGQGNAPQDPFGR
ncbi:MAG TPA: trypsin-like peptidase domain-containing protein [Actinotalea sp.]|nr:trypsin-like peptidase domain-containing protein [Actinotalea sp.]